ncbi:tetratricopeptide repeat protein [Mucilaginibacter segetis]|uniref:Tetratricopeptide repeat protein n=1 Tax=Mucilaginibacter segetis TaxID=2793071 RepID=A0A934PWB8_9SPHI|nr:tetratricopeptide repeat protein [Mucilaginibacter segetis]MBK0381224.1 tetratricopeptide repeat protein [Mucilaginibacter segetis]
MTEANAMSALNELESVAKSLNDLPLQCAVFDMRADYYSVNKGFNKLSTWYHDQAINFAIKKDLPLLIGIYEQSKALYLFNYKQNIPACKYFLLAQEQFREIGYKNVPNIDVLFSQAADFYYALGDYENARINLKNALLFTAAHSSDRINLINTIGLTYRNINAYATALRYFNDALKIAKAKHDSVWIAITTGNIGSVYFMQHQYLKALPLVELDYRESLKYDQSLNAAIALLRLVKISIVYKNFTKAATQLESAGNLIKNLKDDALSLRVELYNLNALLSEQQGNFAQSLVYLKKYDTLKDSLSRRDNIAGIERVRLKWEVEKNNLLLKRLRTKTEIRVYKRNTVIIVLSLLIIISILLYNRQRLKGKKDKALLAAEKLRVDEDLYKANMELQVYTENLMQSNRLIDTFKSEIEKLQLKTTDEIIALQLTAMMQAHIMTDDNWEKFKTLFSNVYPAFFYNLRKNYPQLTATDTRLLTLVKLNLNNKEMAGMLGITTDGVKKSKQRLRKKLNLNNGEELETVVFSL